MWCINLDLNVVSIITAKCAECCVCFMCLHACTIVLATGDVVKFFIILITEFLIEKKIPSLFVKVLLMV